MKQAKDNMDLQKKVCLFFLLRKEFALYQDRVSSQAFHLSRSGDRIANLK